MNVTVSLDSVWNLVQSLSSDNQKWLADKIYENISHKPEKKELVFPHIPKNKKISPEVLDLVADRLPVEIDIEKETDKMLEEWAK